MPNMLINTVLILTCLLSLTHLSHLMCESLHLYITAGASVPHCLNYGLDVLQIYKSWKFNQAYCIPHLPAQPEMKAVVKQRLLQMRASSNATLCS